MNTLPRRLNSLLLVVSLLPILAVVIFASNHVFPFPTSDQWTSFFPDNDQSSIDIANKAVEGNLTFSDLVYQHTGHRIFFSKLITAGLARTTQWSHTAELYVSIAIAIVNLLLLLTLFRPQMPPASGWALVLFAFIVFSLRQDHIWKTGFLNVWQVVHFFLLAAVLVLHQFPIGWRALLVAAALSVGASYSLFSGLLAWPLLLFYLGARGYRQRRYYVMWLVMSALWVIAYFGDYTLSRNRIWLASIFERGAFVLVSLGAPLVRYDSEATFAVLAAGLGLLGLVCLAANSFFLRRVGFTWRVLGVWWVLPFYAIGVGGLTSITRFASYADALLDRYVTAANFLWVAVIALALMVIWTSYQRPKQAMIWVYGNLLVLVIMSLSYVFANTQNEPQSFYPADNTEVQDWATCLLNYPIDRNDDCLYQLAPRRDEPRWYLDRINRLAYNRLGIFAHLPMSTQLEAHVPGEPVLIEAADSWQHFHVSARLPIVPAAIVHIMEQQDTDTQPLGATARIVRATDVRAIDNLIMDADRIWYISVDSTALADYLNDKMTIMAEYPAYTDPQQPYTIMVYERS